MLAKQRGATAVPVRPIQVEAGPSWALDYGNSNTFDDMTEVRRVGPVRAGPLTRDKHRTVSFRG